MMLGGFRGKLFLFNCNNCNLSSKAFDEIRTLSGYTVTPTPTATPRNSKSYSKCLIVRREARIRQYHQDHHHQSQSQPQPVSSSATHFQDFLDFQLQPSASASGSDPELSLLSKDVHQLTSRQVPKCKELLKKCRVSAEDWLLRNVSIQDPEIFMNFDELVSNNGYNVEPHSMETEDGYILSLYRVSKNSDKPLEDDGPNRTPKKKTKRRAVLLVHGFQCAAVSWFLNSPHKTLPYMLVDEGWHEMGRYDVPRLISFILEQRGDDSLHYIGHSMGCSVFFVAMSLRPELCEKVKTMVALGPAVYGSNVRSKPIKWGVAPLANLFAKIKYFHQQEIFGQSFSSLSSYFCPPFLSPERLGGYIGRKYGMFFGGLGHDQIEDERIAKIAGHWPQSTSVKAMCHGMQCIQSKKFQNYDYGESENMERYGQILTPQYDLTKVSCPVATFYARGDELCTTLDVTKLANDLPNLICNVGINDEKFTHGDFIFGKDAQTLVYEPIIKILNKSEAKPKICVTNNET